LNYITRLIIASVFFEVFSDLNLIGTGSYIPGDVLTGYFQYLAG